jgi:lysophospholipase L1-like esterase
VISTRTIVYGALSLMLSLPAFLESYLRSSGNSTLWIAWLGTLLLLWSSWPRYRSRLARAVTYGLSGLVVLNLAASAAIAVLYDEPSPTLAPNLNFHVHFVGRGVEPGIGLDQTVTTNGYGHRTNGPVDYRHKPAGALRLVAIGASTTEERKLDDHKTWTFRVGDALAAATGRKVEVINTALSGVRAEQNYLALREAEAYAPDIVTFLMGINDWNHVVAMQKWSALHRLLSHFTALTFGNSPLYRGLKQASETIRVRLHPPHPGEEGLLLEDDGAYTATSANSLERPTKMSFHPSVVDADYARWVGRIFDECNRKHIFCLFMDQPTAYAASMSNDLRKRLWMTPPFEDFTLGLDDMIHLSHLYNDWMANAVKHSGLAFCPLADKIPPTTDYLTDDCHFNENGARRVAEVVSACLLDHRSAFAGH